MKRMHLFGSLFLMCCFSNVASAQTIEEQMTQKQPLCKDVFANAVNLFPKLYKQQAFDSMYTALRIWKQSCGDNTEVASTTLLLAIQQSTFKIYALDSNTIDLLVSYSGSIKYYQNNNDIYYRQQKEFYKFSSTWAKLLMELNAPDENETFICKVFSGEISDPVKEIKNNRDKYPQFAALLQKKNEAERNGFRTNWSILSGIWIPTGNLKVLGNHPSLGFQFGFRDVHNQLDLTLQFRFVNSDNIYLVKRNNILYETDYYFGGYIGIDYAYYLVSKQQFDFGLLAGMGYDGFDVFSPKYDNEGLNPLSIGSFNANGGLKFNFYVSPTFYLGVQGRYNWINYCNNGGTSMNGNGFSLDFIIGGNKMRR